MKLHRAKKIKRLKKGWIKNSYLIINKIYGEVCFSKKNFNQKMLIIISRREIF